MIAGSSTPAQWIAAFSSTGVLITVLTFVLRGWLGWGKLNIDAKQVAVNAKQVAASAESTLRDHYGKELQSLRNQINTMGEHQLEREREIDERWRETLKESEERHDECVKQRDELGKKVMRLEAKLIGTIRQFVHFQQRIAEAIARGADQASMLASLQPFLEDKLDEGDDA